MSPEIKTIVGGMVLCVIGGVLIDCQLVATGTTLIVLGAMTCWLGPLTVFVWK